MGKKAAGSHGLLPTEQNGFHVYMSVGCPKRARLPTALVEEHFKLLVCFSMALFKFPHDRDKFYLQITVHSGNYEGHGDLCRASDL